MAQDSGDAAGSGYAQRPAWDGYPPAQQSYGMMPYGGSGAPRSGTKTFFIAGLLSLIPFVGFGMAAIYYYTKQQPNAFDGGKAAGATVVAGIAAFVAVGILYALFFLGLVAIRQASSV